MIIIIFSENQEGIMQIKPFPKFDRSDCPASVEATAKAMPINDALLG